MNFVKENSFKKLSYIIEKELAFNDGNAREQNPAPRRIDMMILSYPHPGAAGL
jgi:hypothetical protein